MAPPGRKRSRHARLKKRAATAPRQPAKQYKHTRGTRALSEMMAPSWWPAKLIGELAKRGIRVSQQTVSSWATGRTRPHAKYRTALKEILGIDFAIWDEEETAEHSEAA